jgi:hypothetical protein
MERKLLSVQSLLPWTKRDDPVVPLSPPDPMLAKFPDALRREANAANPYKPKQQTLDFPVVRVPSKRFSPPSYQPRMSVPKGAAAIDLRTDSPGAINPRGSR